LAWMQLEAKIVQFAGMKFTTQNIYERQEERNALYDVLDNAIRVSVFCILCVWGIYYSMYVYDNNLSD
jgi:hypothetical protein